MLTKRILIKQQAQSKHSPSEVHKHTGASGNEWDTCSVLGRLPLLPFHFWPSLTPPN